MTTLAQLYRDHDGKVADKWSRYLTEYDRLLAPYRERPVRLLEIGIQHGGSLEIWSKFFPHAETLVGCDLNPECAHLHYDDPRIGVVVADANTDEARQQILAHAPRFDLIIDDGSHRSGDIVRSFARYFPDLEQGGLYVVEDLHCSYWEEFAGGLFHPDSAMAFFKQLTDVVNHEHWRQDTARSAVLHQFEQRYGVAFSEEALREIHSIAFLNSLCVVTKQEAPDNALGPRVIAGTRMLPSDQFEHGLRLGRVHVEAGRLREGQAAVEDAGRALASLRERLERDALDARFRAHALVGHYSDLGKLYIRTGCVAEGRALLRKALWLSLRRRTNAKMWLRSLLRLVRSSLPRRSPGALDRP